MQRFHKSWGIGRVGQGSPELGNGYIYGVIEVAKGLIRPDFALKFITRNHNAGLLEQSQQHL